MVTLAGASWDDFSKFGSMQRDDSALSLILPQTARQTPLRSASYIVGRAFFQLCMHLANANGGHNWPASSRLHNDAFCTASCIRIGHKTRLASWIFSIAIDPIQNGERMESHGGPNMCSRTIA